MRLMRRVFVVAAVVGWMALAPSAGAAKPGRDVPVPASCVPAVNLKLEQMVRARPKGYTENVMLCGVATKTTVNSGGMHGSHHIISVAVTLPHDGVKLVQVAINDSLDGPVTAAAGAKVFAFGQVTSLAARGWRVCTTFTVRPMQRRTMDGWWSMESRRRSRVLWSDRPG